MPTPRLKPVLLLALLAAAAVVIKQRFGDGSATREPATDPFMAATTRTPPSVRPISSDDTPVMTPVQPETSGGAAAADAAGGGPSASALAPLPSPPHGPFAAAPDGQVDDLKRITGVGPKLERMLNDEGITTFSQLADLTDVQIDELQARLPQFPGRIRRDDWVEQARRLRDA